MGAVFVWFGFVLGIVALSISGSRIEVSRLYPFVLFVLRVLLFLVAFQRFLNV